MVVAQRMCKKEEEQRKQKSRFVAYIPLGGIAVNGLIGFIEEKIQMILTNSDKVTGKVGLR